MALFQAIGDNAINMTRIICEYEGHIKVLKEELACAHRKNNKKPTKSNDMDVLKKNYINHPRKPL